MAHASQARDVFKCEGDGKNPFHHRKDTAVAGSQALNAVDDHDSDARQDNGNQPLVKQAACTRISLKNHRIQAKAPASQGFA